MITRYHGSVDGSADNKSYSITFDVNTGWGHVYEGWYASTAMYMIEELKANNALLREPTNEEMLVLCDIIYQNRLKHAVDKRIRRIETFDEILTFLNNTGIIDATGHYGYLLIQDVWDYFPRDNRKFGWKASMGNGIRYNYLSRQKGKNTIAHYVQYQINHNNIDTLTNSYHKQNEYSHYGNEDYLFYLTGRLQYFKPVTRKWQIDIETQSWYYYYSNNDFYNYFKWWLSTKAFYIFSSRTNVNFFTSYQYISRKHHLDGPPRYFFEDIQKIINWELRLGSTLTYRIAIPTTINFNVLYSRYNYKTANSYSSSYRNTDNYRFTASILHYIY
ncbi:MAG: hypothetical protein GXO93_00295 [FCB group bacterium]|nr:hypothetical protein [FCB group bacterium]